MEFKISRQLWIWYSYSNAGNLELPKLRECKCSPCRWNGINAPGMSKRGVCVCVCLFKVLIPGVGSWFFPCVSHNDNCACPGEAQLVSHGGSFASPPCGGSWTHGDLLDTCLSCSQEWKLKGWMYLDRRGIILTTGEGIWRLVQSGRSDLISLYFSLATLTSAGLTSPVGGNNFKCLHICKSIIK